MILRLPTPAHGSLNPSANTRSPNGSNVIVSDSGTETFLQDGWFGSHAYRQAVFRTGVTSVRVQLAAWDAFVRGRLLLNFWS